ncbi:BZ3500_MvSof-1268-A1-R1_Chr2-1g04107 [Microbotryum saponariae]|uniref:BZ3500_MvSof-1268-A1-R1_Chr2-1g04107 protein n=1 Tax=Microbotryum saponariae TaxID=289078 RepID=A0A2X0MGH2_9BASI|nr:BZ3500_MvSof-1268-A1-R1_Chr2-1g04107 [Microbotryum saponariae]SCZ91094.1 BZ3501_MvSof-1269-A2-R1_Chr2-1g03763 [Microbotryum saponariae]
MSSSPPSVPSSATGGKDDVAAPSKSPFAKLSSLDPSKKYTLVFLVSVGTTLLITGASGGRLLKKVKMPPTADPMASARSSATASSAVASTSKAPIAAAPPPARAVKKGLLARVLKPTPAASTSTPLSASQIEPLVIPPRQLFADPLSFPSSSSSRGRFRILRSWSSNRNDPTAYFLPNSFISSQSIIFSNNVDLEDRLHNDGGTLDEPFKGELGFNPALDAFKALAIATAITLSLFSAGIYGLLKWYKVDDLKSLALAISYDVTPKLTGTNRPTVPTWAQPTSNTDPEPEELDSAERQKSDDRLTPEETNYWSSFKAQLDQEAEEHKVRKVQQWQELQEARRRNGLEGE